MIHPDGIEVYIKSTATGRKYTEYGRPGIVRETPNKLERFIEATTNDTFSIAVDLRSRFKYHDASGVQVSLFYDVSQLSREHWVDRPKGQRKVTWEEHNCYRKVNGQWKKFDLCFGEMTTDEELRLSKEEGESIAAKLGRIRVTLQRGNASDLREYDSSECEDSLRLTDIAAKEVVVNCGVSHCLRPVNEIITDTPFVDYDFERLRGARGKLYVFEFIYRSRMSLRQMGIIPWSPVIEPAEIVVSQGTRRDGVTAPFILPSAAQDNNSADTPHAPIIPLEPEAPGVNSSSRPTHAAISPPQTPSVKREAEEHLPRSRNLLKRIKTIDLTEDTPPSSPRLLKTEAKRELVTTPIGDIPTLALTPESGTVDAVSSRGLSANEKAPIQLKAEPSDEDLDEDDIQVELREIRLRKRLKILQKARNAGS